MPIFSSTIQDIVVNKMSAPYYRLDGASDYITVTDNASLDVLDGDFSIEMVIKSEGPVTSHESPLSRYVVSGEAGIYIYINQSTGNVSLRFNDSVNGEVVVTTTGFDIRDDGEWHHIVWSMGRSGNGLVYVDGVLVNTVDISAKNAVCNITQTLSIGQNSNNGQQFDGSICSVRQWNLALTATEIEELYSGASVPYKYKGANQTDLMVNGNMESNSGWTDYNLSGSTQAQSTTQVHSGTYSWKIDANGGWEGAHSGNMSFVKGQAYKISGWVYREAGAGHFSFHRYNGGVIDFSATTTGATGEWEYIEDIAVAKTTGSSALLIFFLGSAGVAYVDDVKVSRAGAVAEWDGSGIASDKWFDKSGNDLHGTVTGATVENAPSGDSGLVYEEGSWTPTNDGTGWVNSAGDTSTYVRVGKMVTLYIYLQLTSGTGTIMQIAGLPFVSASNNYTSSTNMNHGTNAGQYDCHYRLDSNSSVMNLYLSETGAQVHADNFNATHQIFSITYKCA